MERNAQEIPYLYFKVSYTIICININKIMIIMWIWRQCTKLYLYYETDIINAIFTIHKRTYIIHNISPPFKRDALEHSQHRQAKVVKIGDAEVRAYPAVPTLHLIAKRGAIETVVQITGVWGVHDLI